VWEITARSLKLGSFHRDREVCVEQGECVIGFADRSADRGADVNHPDAHGLTPAHHATSPFGGDDHPAEGVVLGTMRQFCRLNRCSVRSTGITGAGSVHKIVFGPTCWSTLSRIWEAPLSLIRVSRTTSTPTVEISNPAERIGDASHRSKPMGVLTAGYRSRQVSGAVQTIRGSVA
jgi:hypothetical protein